MSSHDDSATESEIRTFLKSAGSLWTVPEDIFLFDMLLLSLC